jgi:DNA-binding NarL/FixJ family response regulator
MTTKEVFFHRRNTLGPIAALEEAVAVAQMLNCFLASVSDMNLFQDTDKSQPIFGLGVVIDAIADTVDHAARVLSDERAEYRSTVQESARKARQQGYQEGEERTLEMLEKMRPVADALKGGSAEPDAAQDGSEATYPKVSPSLSARDAAIAATLQAGYDVKDIARAVNLKQQTVEKIIARLRGEGATRDEDPGDADHAVNE